MIMSKRNRIESSILFFEKIMNKQMFDLTGKTIVLTGAAGFFGTRFARALLEFGAKRLICVDVSGERLQALKYSLGKKIDNVLYLSTDLYDHKSCKGFWHEIAEIGIDVLINNAFDFSARTGFGGGGRIEDATYEQMRSSFESGIYWPFQATQIIGLRNKGVKRYLSVINLGSMYSIVVPDPAIYEGVDYYNPPGYSMAKTGLIALSRYCAAWLAPYVRVNMLCPGAIPDPDRSQNQDSKFTETLIKRTLLKRTGTPDDLVGTIIFLSSDASSYMTGQMICVDGGWTVT